MDLNTIWFILIGVLFSGFYILEGFDYGVGMLALFIGRDEKEHRMLIRTIAPFWGGNEVWILTAGGAIFAAFPHWYATLFSGFYLALALLLLALILRGIALDYIAKHRNDLWHRIWIRVLFVGSMIPSLLWGVALANLLRGTPIDQNQNYVGGFFDLLNPYTLTAGILTLGVFLLQGACYLSLKTEGELYRRAKKTADRLPILVLFTSILSLWTAFPGMDRYLSILIGVLLGLEIALQRKIGLKFAVNCLVALLLVVKVFLPLFPRVMVSSLNPEWSLTIYNASSSPYTLQVMTVVAVLFVPLVLLYQSWVYWLLIKKVSDKNPVEY